MVPRAFGKATGDAQGHVFLALKSRLVPGDSAILSTVADLPQMLQREEGMITAMKATQTALSNDEVRWAIEARQKWERDRITALNVAVEEGEARGEARGRAEGEAESAKRIAKELLALGQSEDVVFRATGLRSSDLE